MTPRTVPCDADTTITAQFPLTHLCPHVNEVDNGTAAITWRVDGQTIELHSLAAYLKGYAAARLSHEQITDRVRRDLALPGVADVTVTTRWNTAGADVTCSTSPTPAVTP